MSYNGIYIRKLIIESEEQDKIEIKFQKGLNVISGSSNTGKSYILECINYILGSKEKPKKILEASTYKRFVLEIETYENKVVTISRDIDGIIYSYDCEYADIENNKSTRLQQVFSEKNSNNISSFLNRLCHIKYSKILSNKKGKVNNFTFRELIHLNVVNEERIIGNESIIYDKVGKITNKKNESVFRVIVEGKDDSDISINLSKEEYASIPYSGGLIKREGYYPFFQKLIQDLSDELGDYDLNYDYEEHINNLNIIIEDTKLKINSYKLNVDDLENKIQVKKEKKEKIEKNYTYVDENIKRFELLKKNYKNDVDRLDFVDESKFYLEQLENLKCPLCGNISDEIKNEEEFRIAVIDEKRLLLSQINDLEEIIFESNIKREKYSDELAIINTELTHDKSKLEETINNSISNELDELEELINSKQDLLVNQYISNKIKKLNQSISLNDINNFPAEYKNYLYNLEDGQVANINANNYNRCVESSIINEICKIAQNILNSSKVFKNAKVSFNYNKMDLVVNGLDKHTYGKGYKALINSAMCIAIIQYTYVKRVPNVGFVILDSPLTAFKDKENKEQINNEVKKEFYMTLSNIEKDIQIIIIDNQEPPSELEGKIKHYHFTGNNSIGRGGLF